EVIARNGVLVSESFANKFGKGVGDVVTLPVARGVARFPITGIYRDYSNDRGVVFMNRRLYARLYEDDTINTIVIYLSPGVSRTSSASPPPSPVWRWGMSCHGSSSMSSTGSRSVGRSPSTRRCG